MTWTTVESGTEEERLSEMVDRGTREGVRRKEEKGAHFLGPLILLCGDPLAQEISLSLPVCLFKFPVVEDFEEGEGSRRGFVGGNGMCL